MKLTRRDAVAALLAGGVIGGGSLAVSEFVVTADRRRGDPELTEVDITTLYSVAEVVYPSTVEITLDFIEIYVRTLDDDRKQAISRTVAQLNAHAKRQYGEPYFEISSRSKRDGILRSIGVDKAQSNSEGTVPERIKYHLVNSLLYALFTSPTGSELTGIQSPVGYPGGFAAYAENDSQP